MWQPAETSRLLRAPTAEGGRAGLRFGKFAVVGAGGYLVNLLLYTALVHGVGLGYLPSAAASFACAVANNYFWNRVWTFRDHEGTIPAQAVRFATVSLAGLGLNLLLLELLVRAGVEKIAAQALAVALVVPANYLGNRHWTFRMHAPADGERSERAAAYVRIAGWWAGSRAVVLGAALAVQAIGWPRRSWYPSVTHEPFALLRAWDGHWYTVVAERGYLVLPRHQSDPAFFPLYPVLMNGLHVLGVPRLYGGLLLANLGFLLGLLALFELARTWLPERDACRTAVYAALFPFGFVFSMVYPESIILAAIALAGALAARRRWLPAGAAAAIAALGRPEGAFVALPLAVLAARRWREASTGERTRSLWAVLAAPAGIAGLALYQWSAVGDPLAFSHAQRMWGRWFSPGGIQRTVHELARAPELHREWLYRDLAFLVVYLLVLALALRAGVPRGWVLAAALVVLLPLWTGSVTSVARFGLLAPPVYAGLAWLGRRPVLDWGLRTAATGLLGAGSATILLHWP